MNRKTIALGLALLFLVLGGTISLLALDREDATVSRNAIVVGPGESRQNVASFGGDILVEGRVAKTVFAMGGSITIAGEVGEAVVGLGAQIRLKSTAVIRGDLVAVGGSIVREDGYQVTGDTVFFRLGRLSGQVFGKGVRGMASFSLLPLIIILKAANAFVWILLAVIVTALFHRQVVFASGQLRRRFWPVVGTGLLGLVIFSIFTAVAAVLCLILIGIPFLLAMVVAGLVVKIFGRVTLFYLVGESLAQSLRRRSVSPAGGALLGLIPLVLAGFFPFLGIFVSLAMSVIGWGIALRTKFGTTQNWFRRGPGNVPPAPPAAGSGPSSLQQGDHHERRPACHRQPPQLEALQARSPARGDAASRPGGGTAGPQRPQRPILLPLARPQRAPPARDQPGGQGSDAENPHSLDSGAGRQRRI